MPNAVMKLGDQLCVYCASASATTLDHVPPKSFFPRLQRKNLVTVPSCFSCNNAISKDEEFVLGTFMFSEAGTTVAGQVLWTERIGRMFQKNIGLRRRMAAALSRVEVRTPAGIYLGRRLALHYDSPRVNRVVQKVVRGLYFREFGSPLPKSAEVNSIFLHTPSQFKIADRLSRGLKPGSRSWPGVFEYRCGLAKDNPLSSGWLLRFFTTALFLVVVLRPPNERHGG